MDNASSAPSERLPTSSSDGGRRELACRPIAITGVGALWPEPHDGDPATRFSRFTLGAIGMAMRDAGWDQLDDDDGLILGTTTANILKWEGGILVGAPDALSRHEPMGVTLRALCDALAFRGMARLVTTACSSSTQAIALGTRWIRQGKVKRCLVGGAEVLSRLTLEGFRSLSLLCASPPAPFDRDRAGIRLAEGAAFLALENESPRARAYVAGYGITSDAHHLTAPHPEGRGCFEAMTAALADAGIAPGDIDWVYAHGTGSPANDVAEGTAIEQLFGAHGVWVSSTKGAHGHALAASGALECASAIAAMARGVIPRTANLRNPDPRMRLKHPDADVTTPIRYVMKNSLGFGGANASLVLARDRG